MTPRTGEPAWGNPEQEGQRLMQPDNTQSRRSAGGLVVFSDDEAFRNADGEDRPAVEVDARLRAKVLDVSSQFTRVPSDASAVTANAGPLISWLESASSEDDLQVRWRALHRQHLDEFTDHVDADDDPGRFLIEAGKLYAFMTGGRES